MLIQGSIVALVTPMSRDGRIEWAALRRLVDWHVSEGTHAIVAVGTTGESATLDVNEHMQVVSSVVEAAAGRCPVIAGTGANSTEEAKQLTRAAADAGANAALLVTPYYNKPTQAGLLAHFKAIADCVELPQILYNVPGRTACDMLPETLFKLAEHPNIVGLKEATGDMSRMKILTDGLGKDFAVFSGDDGTAMQAMMLGAVGNISVTANIVPKAMASLCESALGGDMQQAKDIDEQLQPLHEALFLESNPIPVKWALACMGLIGEGIRLPLTPLSVSHREAVRTQLRALHLLSGETANG